MRLHNSSPNAKQKPQLIHSPIPTAMHPMFCQGTILIKFVSFDLYKSNIGFAIIVLRSLLSSQFVHILKIYAILCRKYFH